MMDKATIDTPAIGYRSVPYQIRHDLVAAQNRAWQDLALPGAWLDGRQRVDVAREVRQAWDCALCNQRKEALSPFAVDGDHDSVTDMSSAEIEIIHRISTDSGRLSEKWLKGELKAGGISEEAYIETVSIICMVLMIDRFAEALGQSVFALPEPMSGEPSGNRAPGAKMHNAWISSVEPEDLTTVDANLYDGEQKVAEVIKALSLVPEAKRAYWALGDAHYIPNVEVTKLEFDGRQITRSQIEVVAARVSAIHQCVY